MFSHFDGINTNTVTDNISCYSSIIRASFNNNTFSIIIKTKTPDMGDLLNTLRAVYSNSVNYYQ